MVGLFSGGQPDFEWDTRRACRRSRTIELEEAGSGERAMHAWLALARACLRMPHLDICNASGDAAAPELGPAVDAVNATPSTTDVAVAEELAAAARVEAASGLGLSASAATKGQGDVPVTNQPSRDHVSVDDAGLQDGGGAGTGSSSGCSVALARPRYPAFILATACLLLCARRRDWPHQ